METDVSRWMVTRDTDFYQQRREKPVSRHGKCLSYGENYVEKEWQQYAYIWIVLLRAQINNMKCIHRTLIFWSIFLHTILCPCIMWGLAAITIVLYALLKSTLGGTEWLAWPWGGIALYMYCIVDLNSFASVRKSDGEKFCPSWESNACFAVSQCARTNKAKQGSRMEALLWYATTVSWWWVMYDNVGQITGKLFHPF